MNKKEYTAKEAAIAVLNKAKEVAKARLAKKQELVKAEQNTAQAAEFKGITQPAPPAGNEKTIDSASKNPLKLKKFIDAKMTKRMKKGVN